MRKTIQLLIMAATMTTIACTMETSDNGDLDGLWQLYATDSLDKDASTDMRQSGIYWAVQARLLELRDVNMVLPPVLFRFENTGTRLILNHPIVNVKQLGDSLVTDPDLLRPYGLSRLSDTLFIEHLDASRMVLETRQLRMHFRKY